MTVADGFIGCVLMASPKHHPFNVCGKFEQLYQRQGFKFSNQVDTKLFKLFSKNLTKIFQLIRCPKKQALSLQQL
ncbi:hypothetical protein PN465_00080 [Nodularia spumigena CS-584]|jgi:hypothetical protein|uniref:hypothetical protein n=1 Tax=Nodularia spumigena TaxID=70799 RepID=UPI0000EACC23|nr:hypothetical protein [Nodularia spumigena]EAW46693.1 hypothetical protein N9414_08610 [Nodularia spumigena CCY9414]MDB9380646.1 hypothetical protein [Nodularia spumigena CS-584]